MDRVKFFLSLYYYYEESIRILFNLFHNGRIFSMNTIPFPQGSFTQCGYPRTPDVSDYIAIHSPMSKILKKGVEVNRLFELVLEYCYSSILLCNGGRSTLNDFLTHVRSQPHTQIGQWADAFDNKVRQQSMSVTTCCPPSREIYDNIEKDNLPNYDLIGRVVSHGEKLIPLVVRLFIEELNNPAVGNMVRGFLNLPPNFNFSFPPHQPHTNMGSEWERVG